MSSLATWVLHCPYGPGTVLSFSGRPTWGRSFIWHDAYPHTTGCVSTSQPQEPLNIGMYLGGHAWLHGGGIRGCMGGCACMAAGGACVAAGGACMAARGMRGCGGACVAARGACVATRGCAWLMGGMGGCRGACMAAGGMHGCGGWHAWLLGGHAWLPCAWLPGGACVAAGGACVVGHVTRTPPLWTDRHLSKHTLRKLRLRAVISRCWMLVRYFLSPVKSDKHNISRSHFIIKARAFLLIWMQHDNKLELEITHINMFRGWLNLWPLTIFREIL